MNDAQDRYRLSDLIFERVKTSQYARSRANARHLKSVRRIKRTTWKRTTWISKERIENDAS